MGRNRQAPPEQRARDHWRAERGTVSPGSSPQLRPASRPRRRGGPGAPRLPRCLARLPRGPGLPPRRGRALTRGEATFQPGARSPESRKQKEGEERRREDTAFARALDSQKPSQSPVQPPPPPPPPGRQGAQWVAGARRPGQGTDWEAPKRRAPAHTSQKARSTRRRTLPRSSSLPACAAPARLLSAPLPRQLVERSASAPPPPPTPPAPPPEAPPPRPPRGGGGGRRAAGAERLARGRTWSACRPRPGPNQASRGGVPRHEGGSKRREPPLSGPEEGGEPRRAPYVDHCHLALTLTRRMREGTLSAPPFWPNGPLRRSAPLPGNAPSRAQVWVGGGGCLA
ncbi:translation initiation factor IF-2-like [Prionailurus bengalensis]|uniref:translation initiation factor IF-2-like n=1 Tax=Prionailurus bengalensis TaxID=37029 RepID=UPI001CA969CA|nr:translation initiation factor IF-2-like [Prionailurus bengalensis]